MTAVVDGGGGGGGGSSERGGDLGLKESQGKKTKEDKNLDQFNANDNS